MRQPLGLQMAFARLGVERSQLNQQIAQGEFFKYPIDECFREIEGSIDTFHGTVDWLTSCTTESFGAEWVLRENEE